MLHPPGTVLGTYYQIESLIGQGGMASVYRARHRVLESVHAIKLLMPHLAARRDVRERFLEEGKIQARLHHPHLVAVTDIITDAGTAGLVMRWMPGLDLRDHLDQHGPLPDADAVRYALQALDALRLVHDSGIVHRDIKPGNLFLETVVAGPPLLRVMDFGIAKVHDKARTRTAMQMGSLTYMSPEQIKSPRDLDARSDLFSLGAVLFELLAGRPAFEAETDFETMRRITEGEHAPLPGPAALHPVLARALAVAPADRFPDAAAFAQALQATVATPLQEVRAELDALRTRHAQTRAALDQTTAALDKTRQALEQRPEHPRGAVLADLRDALADTQRQRDDLWRKLEYQKVESARIQSERDTLSAELQRLRAPKPVPAPPAPKKTFSDLAAEQLPDPYIDAHLQQRRAERQELLNRLAMGGGAVAFLLMILAILSNLI